MRQHRQRIVAGNWKMHGSRSFVSEYVPALLGKLDTLDADTRVVLIPPSIYIGEVRAQVQNRATQQPRITWGAQNVSAEAEGAFTGEIAAEMARDQGCDYCIVGHSERRHLFAETDEVIAAKVEQIVAHGLTAIVCVGETLSQRQAGQAEQVVARQVEACLAKVPGSSWDKIVLAYEPVWAIGTGKTASAGDAQAIHASIRKVLENMQAPAQTIPLLYGGSVKPDNAEELFAQPDIDGGLVGGASLDAESFSAICRAC
ncbi:MAG: triose-phosphate isomerase [Alteromonadaceae bacterium]|nr:triose-phosphate isomerase [Alteromonadaceae bacterium]